MIILEDSDSNEYYRWRYWEEIASARAATSPAARQDHLRLANVYRLQLQKLGEVLPLASAALAGEGDAATAPLPPAGGDHSDI